jgi:Flp pilus assembly protein TadG
MRRTLGADDSGAAVVEFAFVLPVFLVLIAGLYDGARFLTGMLQVHAAAQAGASWAAANGFDADGISGAVTAGAPIAASASPAPSEMTGCAKGTAIQAPNGGGNCPSNAPPGQYVTVSAQAPFTPAAPGFGALWPSTLTAQATVRIP